MSNTKNALKNVIGEKGMKKYHAARGRLAAWLYGRPAKNMKVIAVTGTNGKTTTANLIASIFEVAGYKVALATTIQFRINGKETVNSTKMTVIDPFKLNKFLEQAEGEKCDILVLEVTSISLDQDRIHGIPIDTAVLTNITHDHLDYHHTFDAYVQAKRKLFAGKLRVSVLNIDDPNGREFARLPAEVHYYYSLDPTINGAFRIGETVVAQDRICFDILLADGGTIPIETTLPGDFNKQNIMAATAAALGSGVEPHYIQAGIKQLKHVPGRMELIDEGQPFTVMIDYAHTPDALEKMYQAIRPMVGEGRIISALGSCGDRDKIKRPVLGQIAGREADFCIITNEDPYTEDPQTIIDAVASGVPQGRFTHIDGETYWKVFDRREAIAKAIRLAHPGDVITITGKGAETAMVWGKEHRPWSDRKVVEEELRKLLGKS